MKQIIFLALMLLLNGVGWSQRVVHDSAFFKHKQSYRSYDVWLPEDYSPEKTYHTIYCLDAELLFNILSANVQIYADPSVAKVPPCIVVGIYFDQRNDDMGIIWEKSQLNETGRAFKAFIQQEIMTSVSEKYSTGEYNTIIGHSNSSTFAEFFLWDKEVIFDGILTLSQYELEKDSLRYSEVFFDKNTTINLVHLSGDQDADYRIRSGRKKAKFIMDNKIQELNYQHKVIGNADHLTMVMRGIPVGLELLYAEYGEEVSADTLWKQEEENIEDPLMFINHLVENRASQYGVSTSYRMDDLNALFDLYVLKKDSLNLYKASAVYYDMFQDSSELFYEAQCLEMMGAYQMAEKVYLRHLDYYCCPSVWSYRRLCWLYRTHLDDPLEAVRYCLLGYDLTMDPILLDEIESTVKSYPKLKNRIQRFVQKSQMLEGDEKQSLIGRLEEID